MPDATLRENLEPVLFDLFDRAANVQACGDAVVLLAYHQQVFELERVAKQQGLFGLGYVCMLVESGLIKLVAQEALATQDAREALAAWPALVLSELFSASACDEALSWQMLHQLRAYDWFPDISTPHVALVETRLAEDRARLNAAGEADVADEAIHSIAVTQPMPLDEPALHENDEEALGVEHIDLEALTPAQAPALSPESVPEPIPEPVQELEQEPVQERAQEPEAAHEPVPEPTLEAEPAHQEAMLLDDDADGAPVAEGCVTQEELAMLSDAMAALRDDLSLAIADPEAMQHVDVALEAQLEQLQNIVNAANLVGMTGLRQVLEVALINTAALQAEASPPTDAQVVLLLQWPELAMAYLQSPNDLGRAQALTALFMDPGWAMPAEAESIPDWLAELVSVKVIRARASEGRPEQALPEHVDISAPADIDRKVLDSLLQELPPHAQAFSELVQRLAHGGTLDDAEQARRVAHTLKGAANTVGIKGVANLTHALEDILVAFGREARLPPPAVCDTLVEAADCLEAMSEALLQGDAAPPESLAVHQKVLNWANLIDQDGLPEALAASPDTDLASQANLAQPEPIAPMAPIASQAPAAATQPVLAFAEAEPEATETYLRVPTSLIDALLKLAGESSIVTSQIQDRVKHLSDNINALRAGSRHFGQLSADLEQLVDVRGLAMLGGHTGELDALEMDQYNELHMLSRRIVESGADSREFVRSFERDITGLRDLIAEKERMQLEIQRCIQRTRMVDVASVVPRLQRTVRQAARVLGRSVALKVQGEQTMVDTELLDRIIDPLMHVLRNAVDHGIEPAEVRLAQGKQPEGQITLSFKSEGNNVAVCCEDDGAGLDLAAIRQRALAVGLIQPDAVLSEAEVMRLILVPGFSTRTQATQISGRGIGMDVVQRAVLDLRGTLEMGATPGQGSHFDMHFPVSMSTLQVMLTRSDEHLLAISVRGVEQILPAREELETTADGALFYLMQGERLPAVRLERLLGLPDRALQRPGVIEVAMVIRDEFRQHRVIIVPELFESRTVVVKPFHAMMARTLGVDGATILGDGAVASVLDLPDLLRGYQASAQPAVSEMVQQAHNRLPVCLVVDDSVSVRRTMEQLMHDSGYEVLTARDGVDALGVVQSRAPDIVLVDLEMPRMNGLELTSALRNRLATKATPVVMITSRFTDKHRQLASDAGVNAFLTKPYSEDLLLNTMDGLLRSAA
ncbi:MAG: response regulator [Aquabacterium sp.]|uniref:response regulator n=1 Tax=Aquabacterium sp. TaxID=1872578 RepID=UPI0025BC1D8A|nr:response regulator [Aquabacterium sp.]MBI3384210.1 response regulator [Aquabacterium sp.]